MCRGESGPELPVVTALVLYLSKPGAQHNYIPRRTLPSLEYLFYNGLPTPFSFKSAAHVAGFVRIMALSKFLLSPSIVYSKALPFADIFVF